MGTDSVDDRNRRPALSALLQKWEDFSIILVMLLVNAGLNFRNTARMSSTQI